MNNQRERDLAAVRPYIHEWHLSGSTAIHGIGADYDVVALILKASGCALNKEERAKLFNRIKGLS